MQLKDFQLKAKERILTHSKEVLDDNNNGLIIFKSPTGSGKTFTMSSIIKEMARLDNTYDLCFLWVSIGKGNLEEQSYRALKNFFDTYPDCYLLKEEFTGGRDKIKKNEVVVFNWEKLNNKDKNTNEWTSKLMKDKETYNFRDVIANTKEDERKIVLIIDESHASAKTERAKEIKDIINPNLTIEMSATPIMENSTHTYTVKPYDVINEGLIKKELIINKNIDNISDNDLVSEILILEAAYQKQQNLKEAYQNINVDINPLILVQLPNKDEAKQKTVEDFFREKNISADRGNLSIWLSEKKINTEIPYLKPNNSEVCVLLFKQAIDTGWDCPRAQILVKFRETKSITFEIQTLGRILRMPEAEHYENEILNKGYVYTNYKSIDVLNEEYNPNIIKTLYSKRNDDTYNNITLRSYYKHRISYNDITSSFYKIFENTFCDYFGLTKENKGMHLENIPIISKKMKTDNLTNKDKIILNKSIDSRNFDEEKHFEGSLEVKVSDADKKKQIDKILESELGGYAKARSLSPMRNALYRNFFCYITEDESHIRDIIINNEIKIREILNKAVIEYSKQKNDDDTKKANDLSNWHNDWQVPISKNYNTHIYKCYENNLCLYKPCYLEKNMSSNEKHFVDYLEKGQQNKIVWWWKNGDEHMVDNFGINYDNIKTFQPDFIVFFKDNSIGIYEIKDKNDKDIDTKPKAEALQKYITEENKNGKNLKGGIVIKDGDYLKININDKYNRYNTNASEWKLVEF